MAKAWRCALVVLSLLTLTQGQTLLVSNDGLNVLQYNATTGAFISVFAPGPIPGGLVVPAGLAQDRYGNVYVVSVVTGGIQKYSSTGVDLGTFATAGGMTANSGLTIGPDGNLYVASAGTNTVKKFDGNTGAFLGDFVPAVSVPTGLTFGPDGNLYVISNGNTVLKYNGVTGALIGTFVGTGNFSGAVDLKFGPDGNLYVPSVGGPVFSSVRRFNGATGALIGTFVSTGSGGLVGPTGLAFGPDGNLYVSSVGRVLKYNGATGASMGTFVPLGSGGLVTPTYLLFTSPAPVAQVRYVANLNVADSLINITNTGQNGAPPFGPGIGPQEGNICVNVYAFSPDEQMVGCCSCHITPNGLASLSVYNDIRAITLTGLTPNSMIIKLVATGTGANKFSGGVSSCAQSAAGLQVTHSIAGGMVAWATTAHQPGVLPVPGAPAPFAITETGFTPVTLSAAEIMSLNNRCTAIIGNGSTFGTCRSCTLGARGAAKN